MAQNTQQNVESKVEEVAEQAADKVVFKAKHLAAMAGCTPRQFRAFLRSAKGGYGDSVYTYYEWEEGDPEIKRLLEKYTEFKAEAQAAKAEKLEKAEKAKAQAEADKKAQEIADKKAAELAEQKAKLQASIKEKKEKASEK